MPTGICEALGVIGALASGAGSAIAADKQAANQKKMLREQLMGPIRGGSERAGNADEMGVSSMEKLGEAMAPTGPVYGDAKGPMDLDALFKPKPFGQGYSIKRPKMNPYA